MTKSNGHSNGHITPDQVSFYDEILLKKRHRPSNRVGFYDETLKKEVQGFYRTDGKQIHVSSAEYGTKNAPAILGTLVDHFALEALAQKLLSEVVSGAAQHS
jgi:hypothetical protein